MRSISATATKEIAADGCQPKQQQQKQQQTNKQNNKQMNKKKPNKQNRSQEEISNPPPSFQKQREGKGENNTKHEKHRNCKLHQSW